MTFQHWPSIEGFHNVRKTIDYLNEQYGRKINPIVYKAKIKIHGTNSSVQIYNGSVFAQSRTRIITSGDDNMGFAKWVEANEDYFLELGSGRLIITVFGEWCGKGIMKGVSISKIDRKVFAIFAIQFGDSDDEGSELIIQPELISKMISNHNDIFVLPWHEKDKKQFKFKVDFNNKSNLENSVTKMNELISQVEQCDPWVKDIFDIDGLGEGLVFYPYADIKTPIKRQDLKNFIFKAKGEKHKVVASKTPIQIDPDTLKSINQFVEKFVTEQRLEQGVIEINQGDNSFSQKMIGPFIGWMGKDIKKESELELKNSNLEWKLINKAISKYSRDWYMKKMTEV